MSFLAGSEKKSQRPSLLHLVPVSVKIERGKKKKDVRQLPSPEATEGGGRRRLSVVILGWGEGRASGKRETHSARPMSRKGKKSRDGGTKRKS